MRASNRRLVRIIRGAVFLSALTATAAGAGISAVADTVDSANTVDVTIRTELVSLQLVGGREIVVDDVTYTAPRTFTFDSGSVHTIGTDSIHVVDAANRYVWDHWSDGGARVHEIAAYRDTTITARFRRQYLIEMNADTGGTVDPGTAFHDSLANVIIRATPLSGHTFTEWVGTGEGSYSGTDNPVEVVSLTHSIIQWAYFEQKAPKQVQITVDSNPEGLRYVFDDTVRTGLHIFAVDSGSTHTVSTDSIQEIDASSRYRWTGWSDGGARSHAFTMTGDENLTLVCGFITQYLLTMQEDTGGTVSPFDSFFDVFAEVELNATPKPGNTFTGWTGAGDSSYTGPNNPVMIVIRGPITQTGHFGPEFGPPPTCPPPDLRAGPPLTIWPPNRRFVSVGARVAVVGAVCGGGAAATYVVTKARSDETPKPNGPPTNEFPDIIIAPDCTSVQLRADRDPRGNGRVYVVTVEVTDSLERKAVVDFRAYVPITPGQEAIDDGEVSVVNAGQDTLPTLTCPPSTIFTPPPIPIDTVDGRRITLGAKIGIVGAVCGGAAAAGVIATRNNRAKRIGHGVDDGVVANEPWLNEYRIELVTSDEPENASGDSDGDTWDDIVIWPDRQSFEVRAERDAAGNGRVYTVHLSLFDSLGRATRMEIAIHVPVEPGGTAIDDGPAYLVETAGQLAKEDAGVTAFALEQNAPNPFNPATTIRFSISRAGPVRLAVYDVTGRLIRVLADGRRDAGAHEVAWDGLDVAGRRVANGVYVYRLSSAEGVLVRRMAIAR